MDLLKDESSQERLIEDYLFSGYRPASYKPSSDIDQQFARPIEDEDIFGVNIDSELGKTSFDENHFPDLIENDELAGEGSFDDNPDPDGDKSCLGYGDKKDNFEESNCGDDIAFLSNFSPRKSKTHTDIDVDNIFDDDDAPETVRQTSPPRPDKASENDLDGSTSPTNPNITPARLKVLHTRQNLIEQIKAKGIIPKKLGSPCDKDGMIEFIISPKPAAPKTKGRLVYERMMQRSNESKKGIYGGRQPTWTIYRDHLRQKLCSEKRKVWDSFRKPTTDFDDEEDMVMSDDEPEEADPDDQDNSQSQSGQESSGLSRSPSPVNEAVPIIDEDAQSPLTTCKPNEDEDSDY